jgi:hypothetical protein
MDGERERIAPRTDEAAQLPPRQVPPAGAMASALGNRAFTASLPSPQGPGAMRAGDPPPAPSSRVADFDDGPVRAGLARAVSARSGAADPIVARPATRLGISRQPPTAPPQNPGPVTAPPPQVGMAETATFEPTFEIIPGGLGAGKERTQQLVFRGDTLVFKAQTQNIGAGANLFMGGSIATDSTGPGTLDGDVATWRVVVGKMGVPGKPGEPAEQLEAKPYIELMPPLLNAGKRFEQSYKFRVVADLAWLSGQCSTAGANLNSAFLGVSSMINQAYLNYDEAYQLHKTAVDNNGKRKQLENDILLGILLAGVGGAIGGKLADVIKGKEGVAVATATGDIAKYMVRLGTAHAPSTTGQQGTDTPGNPAASPGTAKAAGVTPERWKAVKEKECIDAAKAGVDICNALKGKMDEAWARGDTQLMDIDPVQLVAPTVESLKGGVDVQSPRQYAIELWRTWLRTYGITAKENWAGGKTRTDETAGHTAFTDSKLFDDIHAQVGDALDDEVARLRQETYPDPLTERPD